MAYSSFSRPGKLLNELLHGDDARWYEWRGVVLNLMKKNKGPVRGMPYEWRAVLKRLKEKKLIEEQRRGDRLIVRVTEDGRYKMRLKEAHNQPDHYPIGEGCIVLFDVPESERVARNMFRNFLKECGFRQLQRSVWVCRKDVADLVARFVRSNKLTPWIQVIEGRVRT